MNARETALNPRRAGRGHAPLPCPRLRALVLTNPNSGRGRGVAVGEAFVGALRGAGHEVEALTIRQREEFADGADDADLVVIVGGDGTVHHSLEILQRERARETGVAPGTPGAPTPAGEGSVAEPDGGPAIYHVPTGTENLFAREFGMRRDPPSFLRAIERWDVRRIDLGLVRGWPFAIMVSVGPDASVIHRVNAGRDGAITHLSYVGPVIAEALRPALPRLTIDAEREGKTIRLAEEERGWLVVANMRQYACRIDPCAAAKPDDGLLDVAFFPASMSPRLLRWIVCSRLRLNNTALASAAGARFERAQRIAVTSRDPAPVQIDGEVGGSISATHGAAPAPGHTPGVTLSLGVLPGALRALVGVSHPAHHT